MIETPRRECLKDPEPAHPTQLIYCQLRKDLLFARLVVIKEYCRYHAAKFD